MDLLSDILHDAGLRGRLLDLRRLGPGRALRFPCDKSIGLHVVTQGRLYVHAPGLHEPLSLGAGDVAVMARGCRHVVSGSAALDGVALDTVSPTLDLGEASDPGDVVASVISGAYQFWNPPLHPFFAEIPDWLVLRADELPRLGPIALSIGLLDEELRERPLGADTIVRGLLDVVFTYILREIVERHGAQGCGWSQALGDPPVRKALDLMQRDSARAWTLEELGAAVGLSRSSFADRFRRAMGDTPLNHLRTLRMQKAMRLLSETPMSLERIACEVGYQDAFGFSKVFKRTIGTTPSEFRRRDEADRSSGFRLG